MDRMLYTAMSGAKHSMDQQSVVSNNLANVSITGLRTQLDAVRAVPIQGEARLDTRTSAVTTTPAGQHFSRQSGDDNHHGNKKTVAANRQRPNHNGSKIHSGKCTRRIPPAYAFPGTPAGLSNG